MNGEPPAGPTGPKLNLDGYPRTLGVILLALGAILGFVGFYFPIKDALQGAAKVTIHSKAIFGCVMFTILGLTFIILGPMALRLTYWGAALKGWRKWLIIGLIMVFCIGSAELVQHVFEQYLGKFGYKF